MGQEEYYKKMLNNKATEGVNEFTYYLYDEQSVTNFVEACKGLYEVETINPERLPTILQGSTGLKLTRLEAA